LKGENNLNNYKQQYNKLLERYQKGEAYVDGPDISHQELEKWMPEFLKIVKDLNLLLHKIGEHTPDEAINGFKEATQ